MSAISKYKNFHLQFSAPRQGFHAELLPINYMPDKFILNGMNFDLAESIQAICRKLQLIRFNQWTLSPMAKHRVLIVDDSKTAQIRLRKMLDKYHLGVDFASSAEEALATLSYSKPAIIFLDHHMEGMDGFEALKIIKANPETATIPVVMYTAQKGDVYVGQARALGALDILSKETFKPSSLERVLASLTIIPKDNASEPSDSAQENEPASIAPTTPPTQPMDVPYGDILLPEIRNQIARLFEIHIANVRSQISENTKFIIRRLSKEVEKGAARKIKVESAPSTPPPVVEPHPPSATNNLQSWRMSLSSWS